MAQTNKTVKFYRGSFGKNFSDFSEAPDNKFDEAGIYFNYSSKTIWVAGIEYGVRTEDFDALSEKLENIGSALDLSISGNTLKIEWTDADGSKKNDTVSLTASNIGFTAISGTTTKTAISGTTVNAAFDSVATSLKTLDGKISTEITSAIEGLDSEKEGAGTHVTVKVKEVDGKLTEVTVNEEDIASAEDLANEISRATTAENAIKGDGYESASYKDIATLSTKVKAVETNVSNIHYDGDGKAIGVDSETKVVSLKIKESEKVLGANAEGLSTTLNLSYDSTNKQIKLLGRDNDVISFIDATNFIKDGMIESATLVTEAEENVTGVDAPYIKLTFNTDADENIIRFSVKDLVDVYDGSNLKLTATSTFTDGTVLDEAIKSLKQSVDSTSNKVVSFGGQTGAITVDTTGTAEAGHNKVKFAISSKHLTATVEGLGSAAYVDVDTFATSAQGEKANSALQSITKGTDEGEYVTTKIGTKSNNTQTVAVKLTLQTVESASDTAKGLAEASDVKAYVDSSVENVVNSMAWIDCGTYGGAVE